MDRLVTPPPAFQPSISKSVSTWYHESEEEMFYSWCVEAKTFGVIEAFQYQPPSLQIFDKVHYQHEVQLKTKIRIDKKVALNGLSYTADYLIKGDMERFHTPLNKIIWPHVQYDTGFKYYYIDIKGFILHHTVFF